MFTRFFSAAALAVVLSHPASANINTWTPLGPDGGLVQAVSFGQSGAVYALASGVYRSQNGGASWTHISPGIASALNALALDPSDPSRIYVAAGGTPSLYLSTDGGATLQAMAGAPVISNATNLVVSQDGNTLYVTSATQVYRSTNRGQTWQTQGVVGATPTGGLSGLVISPTDANTLYVIFSGTNNDSGVYGTHDGGQTWQLLDPVTTTSGFASNLAINPLNPQQLYAAWYAGLRISTDGGLHWTTQSSILSSSVSLDPVHPTTVYITTPPRRTLKSTDGGQTWVDVSAHLPALQQTRITVDPQNSDHLLSAGQSGIGASSDGGLTWVYSQTGIDATSVLGISTDPGTDRVYFNVQSLGLYYVKNGIGQLLPVRNDLLGAVSPAYGLQAYAMLAQPGRLTVALYDTLAVSRDGGNTWSAAPGPAPADTPLVFLAGATTAQTSFIAAPQNGGIVASTDGSLWSHGAGLPAGATAFFVLSAPSNPAIAYALLEYPTGSNGIAGVYATSDAGLNWHLTAAFTPAGPYKLLAVDPFDAATLYGQSGMQGLLKSVDGGATWTAMNWPMEAPAGTVNALSIDPHHRNILVAAADTRVLRSVDGGATWEHLRSHSDVPAWLPLALAVDPNHISDLLVGTQYAGVHAITIAPDLAVTMTGPAAGIAVGDPVQYAVSFVNQGPFDASGVRVKLTLPASAQNLTAALPGGACTITDATVLCTLDVLRNGAAGSITLTAVASAAGDFTAGVSVESDQEDANTANNIASTTVPVGTAAAPTPTPTPAPTPPASGGTSGAGGATITSSSSGGGALSPIDLLFGLSLLGLGWHRRHRAARLRAAHYG